MKIYISGKISGLSFHAALVKFCETENMLRDKGFTDIVNPMKLHLNTIKTWKEYMITDINALFSCDAIFMQPDWIISRGARIEYAIAKELGLRIIFEEEVPF